MMKLLNSFVSPFAARVRLAIYAYDLPVEIAPSGQWLPSYEKSPDYLAINPIGRVPTLLLDDGSALPESGIIVEYLADAFPASGLRPRDIRAAAQARLSAQIVEHYVQMPAGPLFGQLFAQERDSARIQACVTAMDEGLSHLDHFLADESFSGAITLRDCALVPFLFFFAERTVAALGMPPILGRHSKVAAYWDSVQSAAPAQRILAEMRTAIATSPLNMLMADADEAPAIEFAR